MYAHIRLVNHANAMSNLNYDSYKSTNDGHKFSYPKKIGEGGKCKLCNFGCERESYLLGTPVSKGKKILCCKLKRHVFWGLFMTECKTVFLTCNDVINLCFYQLIQA